MTTKAVSGFLADWSKTSKEHKTKKRKRTFNNFEVEISPSVRFLTVRINSIYSTKPGSGQLNKLLSWLSKRADKHGVILTLCAQPFGWNKDDLPDKDKLKQISERYGFSLNYEYPDGYGYEMIRQPK